MASFVDDSVEMHLTFRRINNLFLQHARREFREDPSKPRHLLRAWIRDSELTPRLPNDIKCKFDAMFSEEPTFYPLDEIEEDQKRQQTGIFTASCKDVQAAARLKEETKSTQ